MSTASETADLVAAKILSSLIRDIRDRRGLKSVWMDIDRDVMEGELIPAWKAIIAGPIHAEIDRLTARNNELEPLIGGCISVSRGEGLSTPKQWVDYVAQCEALREKGAR